MGGDHTRLGCVCFDATAVGDVLWEPDATCPVVEDLQPRLMLMQTNDLASAERNAKALRKAIHEIG